MFNNNPLQGQIDSLESQISRLKSLTNQTNNFSSNLPLSQPTDLEQIRNLIKQEVSALFPQQLPNQEPAKPVQLSEQEKLMKDINDLATAVLSTEDIQFLNSPDMIKCVPVFLKSGRGKEAMALLMQEYRSYIDGK